jgi:uncharacterized protein YkwD
VRVMERRALLFFTVLLFSGMLFTAMPVIAQTALQSTESSQIYLPLMELAAIATPLEQQVVDLTNEYRRQNGCEPLALSPQLTIAARDHSQDMADNDYFSHNDLFEHNPGWRAQQAGYTGLAGWENIAAGYPTAADVVSAWYNESPPNDGHRRNMLNCSLNDIGVGYAYNANSTYGSYWTQDFGIH